MRKEVQDIVSTMNIYEKQELVKVLTEEITLNYNFMLSHLNNIDGYVFGMIANSENNNLNELTMKQLSSIKELSKQVKDFK